MKPISQSLPVNYKSFLLTFLLFYAAGYLSLPLTWQGHHVAAIWPPAGIGLGAALIWGNSILPAIYLADLLVGYDTFSIANSPLKWAIVFLNPLAPVLQSWLGSLFARKFADFPNELVAFKSIFSFFLWSGPIACFFPAILGVAALSYLEIIRPYAFAFTFISWWMAKCCGIAIFTPLFFMAFEVSQRIWRQRVLSMGMPVVTLLAIVVFAYLFAQNKELNRLHNVISEKASNIKDNFEYEFRLQSALLERYNRLTANRSLDEDLFRANVLSDAAFHRDLVQIFILKPQTSQSNYQFSILLSASNGTNDAIDNKTLLTAINDLNFQNEAIRFLTKNLYMLALPNEERGSGTCNCIKSVTVGVFNTTRFINDALWGNDHKHLYIKITDNLVKPVLTLSFGERDSGSKAESVNLVSLETINFGKQNWFVEVSPGKQFWDEHYSWSSWQLLVGGTLLTGFLSLGLLLLTGHTALVESQVERRTQELRRSNDKLAARERQFRKLVQTQSAIVWRADPVTFRFVFVSAEAVSILGYPVKQWLDEPDFWQKHLHEDDKEAVLNACANNSLSTHNKSVDMEYRMIAADGHIVWLRDIATLVVEEGVITELYGFMIDITRQKHSEEQLRLAANTFETQQGIMITDKDANILRVNKAFTQITGYTAPQVIGKNPRILKSGRHDKAFFTNYWSQLLNEGKFEGEIWNRRSSGEIYPEWQTVTAVRNEQGDISHFVSVFSDITEKKDAENRIHNMAFYDALTNLPNRRLLLDRFDQELAISRRHNQFGAVLYLDLDHFKVLNDSQGHLVGDELLIQVAGRLCSVLREEDTPARLGGDEFVILLHANSETLSHAADHAMVVAEKVREQLNRPFELGNCQHQIGTSIGIALFPDGQQHPDAVLQQADTAMYRSKSSGRNTISFFHASMQEAADLRLSLEQDLRGAIDQGRFILCYHPQVDVSGNIIGVEALIRWEDKVKGRLSPAEFIPVAEESNLILTIGKWVLVESCNQLKMWEDDGLKGVPYVSVNVSSRQFRQQDFVSQVKHVLDITGIKPDRLGLELTESIMIVDMNDTIDKMKALKALGVTIAVDDFGTGYSSLAYLKRLPLDVLKIDRSFVRDILTDSNDAVIVQTIISMANHMNIKVIAEGVETSEQLEFLREKGCDIFQGYYFNKPMTAADFAESYLKKIDDA